MAAPIANAEFIKEFRQIQLRDTGKERALSLQSSAMQRWRAGSPCDPVYVLSIMNTPTEIIRRCWEHDIVQSFGTFDDATQEVPTNLLEVPAVPNAPAAQNRLDYHNVADRMRKLKDKTAFKQAIRFLPIVNREHWDENPVSAAGIIKYYKDQSNMEPLRDQIMVALKCTAGYDAEWHRNPYVGAGIQHEQCLGVLILKQVINAYIAKDGVNVIGLMDRISQHALKSTPPRQTSMPG